MNTPLEQACRARCSNCREAARWAESGRKGHTLRKREDTGEWVHDFLTGKSDDVGGMIVDHRFCYASDLRNQNG